MSKPASTNDVSYQDIANYYKTLPISEKMRYQLSNYSDLELLAAEVRASKVAAEAEAMQILAPTTEVPSPNTTPVGLLSVGRRE